MQYALANEPHPMSSDEVQRLTWDAATERFLDVTELSAKDLKRGPLTSAVDSLLWATHNTLTGGMRRVAGAPCGAMACVRGVHWCHQVFLSIHYCY